ncbi:MAG: hypothetical protein EXQ63_08760 [Ilumatobacteraceae bacterium]|nr:hypothetical protein [Ilumatobacteraceae bacterium]
MNFPDDTFDPNDQDPMTPTVPTSWFVQWRSSLIALAVLGTIVGIIAVARQPETPIATTTLPATTTTVSAVDITNFELTRTLKKGMRGDDARRVQQRLKDLHFDPGPIDGVYGGDTITAIWAYQALVMKMTRDTITDFVTPVLWDSMRGTVAIAPRRTRTSPTHVEIYLPEQVMVVFKGDAAILITHISSGSNLDWCEEVVIDPGEEGNTGVGRITDGACGKSITPGGVYAFYMRKNGLRESQLGTMWNPVYFNYGIAIHGAMQVPKYPASHGCIRIPIFVSEYFPAMVQYSDRVFVFDGVKEPEAYGSPTPYFNRPWPEYTTTTSSTSSTSTTSTMAPPPVKNSSTTVPAPAVVATTTTVVG